jgi:nucleoredoxin
MQSIIGDFFISRDNEVPFSEVEKCQVVGLYYTAGWCPPCRIFNPTLLEFYNDVNYPDKRFEVIQITSDHEEIAFNEYFGGMPWVAIPYNDARIKALKAKFKVTGIPLLLLLNKDGTLAHGTARADIQTEGPACFDRWVAQFYPN